MTTAAAERLYLAQHLLEVFGRPVAIFNPQDTPVEELPVIYGFNNGGSPGWYSGRLLASDGTRLGGQADACCLKLLRLSCNVFSGLLRSHALFILKNLCLLIPNGCEIGRPRRTACNLC